MLHIGNGIHGHILSGHESESVRFESELCWLFDGGDEWNRCADWSDGSVCSRCIDTTRKCFIFPIKVYNFLYPCLSIPFSKLKQSTILEWRIVFWISFVIFLVTTVVYTIWASGEVQPWNYPKEIPSEEHGTIKSEFKGVNCNATKPSKQ